MCEEVSWSLVVQCHESNLNGMYHHTNPSAHGVGVIWPGGLQTDLTTP